MMGAAVSVQGDGRHLAADMQATRRRAFRGAHEQQLLMKGTAVGDLHLSRTPSVRRCGLCTQVGCTRLI